MNKSIYLNFNVLKSNVPNLNTQKNDVLIYNIISHNFKLRIYIWAVNKIW
jgi:hypothetical protein